MSVDSRTRVMVAFGLLLLLMSTAVNVLQAHRIRGLLASNKPGTSIIGKRATSISGRTLQGQPTVVALDERRPTLLYYFSSSCGWCERNWANVEALRVAANDRYRVVAISSERGLEGYANRHQLAVDVVEGISENVLESYAFYGTPHTLFIDADGLVTHEWRGAFSSRIARQLEDLFDLSLPGVQESRFARRPD